MKTLIEKVLHDLLSETNIQICANYGEQGYDLDGKRAVLFSDWNDFDKYPNFMEWLATHYCIEWCDEWITDPETNKCYRTQASSYGWQQQFRVTDAGELITPDSDIEDWIYHAEITQDSGVIVPVHCLPDFIDYEQLEKLGYECLNDDLENGWYGKEDRPDIIAAELLDNGHKSILFRLTGTGPWSINFEVWAKR